MYAVRRMYLPGATFNCFSSIAIEGNGTGSVKLTHGLSAMKHKLGGSTPAVRRKVDNLRELSHRLSFYEYCSGVLWMLVDKLQAAEALERSTAAEVDWPEVLRVRDSEFNYMPKI